MFFPTGKGLEVSGTFSRKNSVVYMDMTFSNKAMQPLSNFGIQFNKNSFGVAPAQPLNVPAIPPNQSVDVSLPLNTSGPVQKMDPLTNLQVKNFLQHFHTRRSDSYFSHNSKFYSKFGLR